MSKNIQIKPLSKLYSSSYILPIRAMLKVRLFRLPFILLDGTLKELGSFSKPSGTINVPTSGTIKLLDGILEVPIN